VSTATALSGLSEEDELPPLTLMFFLPIFCRNCLNFFPPDCDVELVCVVDGEDMEECSLSDDKDLKEAKRFC
jgi:hypothetical protein